MVSPVSLKGDNLPDAIFSMADRICFSPERRGAIEQMYIEMVANRGICLQRSGAAYRPKGIAFRSRM